MVKLIMALPNELYQTLITKGSVTAKTNFATPPSKKAYQTLKEKSEFDNFFFAFKPRNEDEYAHCLENLPAYNDRLIEFEMPDNEPKFEMGYYEFSDLIYAYDLSTPEEEPDKTIQITKDKLMTGTVNYKTMLVQVTFPKIKKSWLKSSRPIF